MAAWHCSKMGSFRGNTTSVGSGIILQFSNCLWTLERVGPAQYTIELETKVKRRFAKVSKVSYVYLPWGQHLFSIV